VIFPEHDVITSCIMQIISIVSSAIGLVVNFSVGCWCSY